MDNNSESVKSLFTGWQQSFDESPSAFLDTLNRLAKNADIHFCYPFGSLQGSESVYEHVYMPLFSAMPDIERRDLIVMAGTTPDGQQWLGSMGNYMGTLIEPFLGIAPTGKLVHMRFHEFFRFENGKITEIQAIWDIPELMMQAGAWPMAPQLGTLICTPAPLTGDGLSVQGDGSINLALVKKMLVDLCRHPTNPDPKVMQLTSYWHTKVNWYGPAGIGACRGISGFRHWHQVPFLHAMPDRKLDAHAQLHSHWFAQGQYVCETGWPNMRLTLRNSGWMGIAANNQEVVLRSLDFWRLENGKIRENWVLIDILDLYSQINVDVFARMHEFNKTRNAHKIQLSQDY